MKEEIELREKLKLTDQELKTVVEKLQELETAIRELKETESEVKAMKIFLSRIYPDLGRQLAEIYKKLNA